MKYVFTYERSNKKAKTASINNTPMLWFILPNAYIYHYIKHKQRDSVQQIKVETYPSTVIYLKRKHLKIYLELQYSQRPKAQWKKIKICIHVNTKSYKQP